jgi:hypothetical protein
MIEKVGDWDKVRRVVDALGPDITEVTRKTLIKIGLKAERTAVDIIERQDFPNKDLSVKYRRWKERKGLSEKTLIATSTYFQAITSWPSQTGKTVYAGVKRTVRNAEGQVVADIAKALEFGVPARGIPPRPVWKMTYTLVAAWIRDTNIFAHDVHNHFVKKFGG